MQRMQGVGSGGEGMFDVLRDQTLEMKESACESY